MPGRQGGLKMVMDYTNSTFINLTKLQEPPNITVNISTNWPAIDTEVQTIFSQFSWLEITQSLGVFLVFYVLISNQKILNLTNMQVIMAASFITIIYNVFMLYKGYYTSFYMLGAFFIVWVVSLITTIRDN